jgi:hypothetical protein
MTTKRRVRIKIFNEKGYESASIHIPYFSKKHVSKIKDLKGIVYNIGPNGEIIMQRLEEKDFFRNKLEDNVGIISFSFPNIKPGSVIEYQYTEIEKDIISVDPWLVQDDIPTAYSTVVLITPITANIKQKYYGRDSIPEITDTLNRNHGDYARTQRTYFTEDIRAFEKEPFMSSLNDNLIRVGFILVPERNFLFNAFSSPEIVWRYTGMHLLESPAFREQLNKTIPGTDSLINSANKMTSRSKKINMLFTAVQQRMPSGTEQTMHPEDIFEAWANKTGNTAEVNLILLNLLKKAGIECYPLLVSTRDHGRINTEFPGTGQLNGMDVVAVDSLSVYVLDASIKNQSYQYPPFNVINRKALVVYTRDVEWIMITDQRPLIRQRVNIQADLNTAGTITGHAEISYFDYAKLHVLDSTDNKDKEDKFIDKTPAGVRIISVHQDSMSNSYDPLVQQIEFSYEPESSDKFYFIKPQTLFLKNENPFIKEIRNTDIDFACNQSIEAIFQLNIPPGFNVEKLPKNTIVRAPDTSFLFSRFFSFDSSLIFMRQTFQINKPVFDKEDYQGVREFFTRVYALMEDEIILKRKE